MADAKRPLYRIIYDDLVSRVRSGRLKAGNRIPAEKEWAASYNVSRITAKRALELAAERGIITRQPGKGSFVTKDARIITERVSRQTPHTIGVIVPELSDLFDLDFFMAFEQLAHENEFHMLTGVSNKSMQKENELILRFRDYPVEGMVVFPVHNETFNNEILNLIIGGLPVVLIDRYLRDVSVPNVITKNQDAARRGMEHLYSLGHRNIGIVSRPISSTTSLQEREKGVLSAIADNGLPNRPDWWLTNLDNLDDKSEERFEEHTGLLREFLSAHPELTAVFCLEYSAIPMLLVIADERGWSVPGDLSLMSFDCPGHVVNHIRPVTHLCQNERKIAETAFELIRQMLEGEDLEVFTHKIDADLVIGKTTGPPARSE